MFTIVSKVLAEGRFGAADTNAVYFVLTSPEVTQTSSATDAFCTSYCGWHTYDVATNLKYVPACRKLRVSERPGPSQTCSGACCGLAVARVQVGVALCALSWKLEVEVWVAGWCRWACSSRSSHLSCTSCVTGCVGQLAGTPLWATPHPCAPGPASLPTVPPTETQGRTAWRLSSPTSWWRLCLTPAWTATTLSRETRTRTTVRGSLGRRPPRHPGRRQT